MFVVELSYTDIQQHTVMIILVNARLAFVAVSHSTPFQHSTGWLQTHVLLSVNFRSFAVFTVTGWIIGQDEVVKKKGEYELVVRVMGCDKGDSDDDVREEDDSAW